MLQPAPPSRGLLAALFLAVLTAALDIAMVIPAIPVIGESFALNARWVAWVYAVFTLCSLAGVPIMAWLADNYDRKRVLIGAIALFVAGASLVGLSRSFPVLLLGRGLQGLAAAGIFPVVSSVVGDLFPGRRRGRALGILGSVFGIAFIVGPPISGILLQINWRFIFMIAVPLGVAAMTMILRYVPRPQVDKPDRSFDGLGLGLLFAIVLLLAYALNSLDADDLAGSVTSVGFLVPIGLILLAAPLFVGVERRARRPVVRLALFQSTDVRIVFLLAIGAGFCESAMVFTPYFAGEAFGVDRATASFMFIPLALAVAIGSPVFGRMIDHAGVRFVVSAACAVLLAGLLGYAFSAGSQVLFYASSIGVGLGLAGLLGAALNYIMLNASKVAERTTTQGFVTLSLNVGLSLGAAVVGAIVASSSTPLTGFRNAFLFLSALSVGLLLMSFGLSRVSPAEEVPTTRVTGSA